MLSMVTGAMCYAVTIGHVSVLVNSTETAKGLYKKRVNMKNNKFQLLIFRF